MLYCLSLLVFLVYIDLLHFIVLSKLGASYKKKDQYGYYANQFTFINSYIIITHKFVAEMVTQIT